VIPKTKSPYTLKELLLAFFQKDDYAEVHLEQQFAEMFGFPYGLFFNYGRSGLFALLRVLGLKGEKIVIPAYTCVVVANAILLSGNKVKFVDNEPDHFNVSPNRLSSAISKSTKVIIPTPLMGYPIDRRGYERVISLKAPEAFILYDNAQGFGAEDHYGLQSSSADGALFGLGEGKVISSLYGGMLLLRDKSIYEEVKAYRNREFNVASAIKNLKRFFFGFGYWMAYRNPTVYLFEYLEKNTTVLGGLKNEKSYFPFPKDAKERPTKLQAKLGKIQLSRYQAIIEERRKIARLYEKKIHANGLYCFTPEGKPANSHFPYLTNDRNLAINALRKYDIMAGYPFLNACPELPGYDAHSGNYPNAALMAKKLIALPIWPGMAESHIDHVVASIIRCNDKYPSVFNSSKREL